MIHCFQYFNCSHLQSGLIVFCFFVCAAKERTRHETEEMLLSTYTSNENWYHPGVWAHPVFLSEDNVREDAETKWSFLADARWSCCSSSEQKGRGCMMREPK
jgi:hypothetical protein